MNAIGIPLAIVTCGLFGFKAVADLITGNWWLGENYLGQPIDAALQLLGAAVVLTVGAILLWKRFFKEDEREQGERKKGRRPEIYFPHDNLPF